MNHHPADEVLQSFAQGELGDHLAAHTARHIDSCPRCANRALALDPMARAFASVDDPPVPPSLIADLLEAAAKPEVAPSQEPVSSAEPPDARPLGWAEIGVGGLLLTAAWATLWLDPGIANLPAVLRLGRATWATLRALGPSLDQVVLLGTWTALLTVMLVGARMLQRDGRRSLGGAR